MDVVWLKRDVRLHDHGPLAEVARSNNPFVLLYLYEPDQLADPTAHGSHLQVIHEGLVDFDQRLRTGDNRNHNHDQTKDGRRHSSFQYLTICHATMISTLEAIHANHHRIGRLLAHEETGHWQSFQRDKAVRQWCQANHVTCIEYNQTGVTRCLTKRDDYSKKFQAFVSQPRHATPRNLEDLRERLVVLSKLPGYLPNRELDMDLFVEIPKEHRVDRPQRQQTGGETKALATLESFLSERGSAFSQGISSPNSSWTSCSRLSPYLSWGHVSLRHVMYALRQRQNELRTMQQQGRNIGTWLRSLQAFSSRIHWRSHFIQKLESEPQLEKRDLCPAYQLLRRQAGDWNEDYYHAWATGRTGFPFVDACMRCLLAHGWLNFRMRAMLISFGTYNCWLDWKRLAPHMARVFLDYEPGIHYPQLQMQAGTTGINAMRVYNVTKQGKDQDPDGRFIRRFVKELSNIPNEFIHEPWRMPQAVQRTHKIVIGDIDEAHEKTASEDWNVYPAPIVDEQESARMAKAKVAAIRKQEDTKTMANTVFQKHGSRSRRRDEFNGKKAIALSTVVEKESPNSQPKISTIFAKQQSSTPMASNTTNGAKNCSKPQRGPNEQFSSSRHHRASQMKRPLFQPAVTNAEKRSKPSSPLSPKGWNCRACTYFNEKPLGLVCSVCGTTKR